MNRNHGLFLMSVGFALTLLPFVLKWGVWLKIGTFAEVKAGGGYPFMQQPFFYGWLFIMSYMIVTGVVAGLWFKIKGNTLTR